MRTVLAVILGMWLISASAEDVVHLDPTTIIGNRELPKVLYIVPWKKSPSGDLVGRPVASLLDEALAPVDRDVFGREIEYYHLMQRQAAAHQPPIQ